MKVLTILLISTVFTSFFVMACSPSGPHQPIPVTKNGDSDGEGGQNVSANFITFQNIKPIFGKFCMECHFEKKIATTINWLDYEQAKKYVKNGLLHREVVKSKRMPMPNKTSGEFTQKHRDLIEIWINNGSYQDFASVPPEKLKAATPPPQIDGEKPPTQPKPIEDIPNLDDIKKELVQSCMACHGEKGMSSGGVPHLAGLSKNYILTQLKAFSGEFESEGINKREDSPLMIDMVSNINDPKPDEKDEEIKAFSKIKKLEYLADFFSRFNFTESDIENYEMDAEDKEVYAKGKDLAQRGACLTCHSTPLVPRLVGQDESYIESSLYAFQEKTRKNETMISVVERMNLDSEAITALAFYLSFPDKVESFDITLLNKNNLPYLYQNQCASCHNSEQEFSKVPYLSGLKPRYVETQFKNFSKSKRQDLIFHFMPTLTKALSKSQQKLLSGYIEKMDRCDERNNKVPEISEELKLEGQELTSSCLSCHNVDGKGGVGPQIHGQKAEYLFHSINAFDTGERDNALMKAQIHRFSQEERKKIATYLSSQINCPQEGKATPNQ